jgi:hypothetical protein
MHYLAVENEEFHRWPSFRRILWLKVAFLARISDFWLFSAICKNKYYAIPRGI